VEKNSLMIFKKRSFQKPVTAAVLAGLCFMARCAHRAGSEYNITAVHAQSAMSIDGILDEPAWRRAAPVFLRNNRSGQEVNGDASTRVMTCYDDSTLYIGFICADRDIWTGFTRRDEHLWTEEAVEVFIDADDVPDTYVEIEVSPANVLFDSYIVDPQNIDIPATAAFNLPGIRTAVSIDGTLNVRDDIDNNWKVEIAVPFRDLAAAGAKNVFAGKSIKVNFFRLDRNQGMASAGYAWSPTHGRFHNPAAFGRLLFKK
jgi:hypothetical protein